MGHIQGARAMLSLKTSFMVSLSPAAFPASGSGQRVTFGRNPYLYIEERERHPVFPDFCKAARD
jgi:hypothetical protein